MDDRTIILAEDGRFVTLGRYSVPSEAELAQAVESLTAQGIGAWLATMHGTAYQRRAPKITRLRELTTAQTEWEGAVSKFREWHKANVATMGSK